MGICCSKKQSLKSNLTNLKGTLSRNQINIKKHPLYQTPYQSETQISHLEIGNSNMMGIDNNEPEKKQSLSQLSTILNAFD